MACVLFVNTILATSLVRLVLPDMVSVDLSGLCPTAQGDRINFLNWGSHWTDCSLYDRTIMWAMVSRGDPQLNMCSKRLWGWVCLYPQVLPMVQIKISICEGIILRISYSKKTTGPLHILFLNVMDFFLENCWLELIPGHITHNVYWPLN
jgi:hypothetical protein